jgi:hypothetical protein
MPLGRPVSQLCGLLQGRSDRFSDSVLAHPASRPVPITSSSNNHPRRFEAKALTKPDARE